jgi:hypothetical protein
MCKHIVRLFALVLCVVRMASAQHVPDLDTRFLTKSAANGPEGPIASTNRALPRGQSPISLQFVRIKPTACIWGEPIAYDVRIQNVSSVPLLMPWSLAPQSITSPRESERAFRGLVLSLEVTTPSGVLIDAVETLQGDPSDPASMRLLSPNDSVLIRVGTRCTLMGVRAAPPTAYTEMPFTVRARVTALRSRSAIAAIVTSNEATLYVTKAAN